MNIVLVLGEYRLSHAGRFVGCEDPGSDRGLVVGEEVCLLLGAECDSIGFVFPDVRTVRAALARITNACWSLRHVNP